jgi:Rrf2 family transcriptional repressor of oqxAB
MVDTRFPTALQIILTVAANDRASIRTTSQVLAESLNTNPSFVRKTVAILGKAGILASIDGLGGGVRLGRASHKITLLDIHRSVLPEQKVWSSRGNLTDSSVSQGISAIADELGATADGAVARMLADVTVRDCIAKIEEIEALRTR